MSDRCPDLQARALVRCGTSRDKFPNDSPCMSPAQTQPAGVQILGRSGVKKIDE